MTCPCQQLDLPESWLDRTTDYRAAVRGERREMERNLLRWAVGLARLGWSGDNYLGQIIVMGPSQVSALVWDHFVCGEGGEIEVS